MDYRKDEKGFSFYTLLFTLTVLIICIPLYGGILKTLKENTYYDEISIQQFFHFIQQDVISSERYRIEHGKVYLTLGSGEIVTFEQYKNLIRRQVDKQGHEVYLRDIQEFQVRSLDYGFKVFIISAEGEQYEKTITFYP